MNKKYINIYNNLVNLTRNKNLYKSFKNQDTFSDRLTFFLIHFSFFLKEFKKDQSKKKILQEIYDFIFKQLELSIREIGYGDATINKKMKDYINVFYAIIDKIDNWENISSKDKEIILSNYLNLTSIDTKMIDYFDNYRLYLANKSLNSLLKGVINHKF